MSKIDFKKDLKHLYNPSKKEISVVDVPGMNFLVIDGILKSGFTTSVQDVKGFFSKNSYRLGAHVFSLDEIEHGVLRNNQRRPYSLFRPFGGTDPRQASTS